MSSSSVDESSQSDASSCCQKADGPEHPEVLNKPAVGEYVEKGVAVGLKSDASVENVDAPVGHSAYDAVRIRRKGRKSYAFFFVPRSMDSQYCWIDQPPKVQVDAESVGGSLEHAARIARLCFLHMEQGANLKEARLHKRRLCKECRGQSGWKRPSPTKRPKRACRARCPPTPLQSFPPLQLSALPVPTDEYQVGHAPPGFAVAQLFGLMNARECVARNRARGLAGPLAYTGMPKEYAAYFQRYVCPNVRRRYDRPTRELRRLAAAEERFKLCKTAEDKRHLRRLLLMNFTLWRFVGGTLAFARAVGFLMGWTETERERVRDIVRMAFEVGRIDELFSAAYQSCAKLRKALHANADQDRIEAVLYNTGPKALNGEFGFSNCTLEGKLRVLDKVWEVANDVVDAAAPDPSTGRTRWRPAVEALGRVPYFGTTENGYRLPTFFAKEVVQDLLDTPFFEGGRANVSDLRSFCPAGPGALLGLMLVYKLEKKPFQKTAIPMMLALLEAAAGPDGWDGDPGELELHDVQFMLCELQKFFHRVNPKNALRDYQGPRAVPPGPPLLAAGWLEILEDALMLFHEAEGGAKSSSTVCKTVGTWLGLHAGREEVEGQEEMPRAFQHGDTVSFFSDGAWSCASGERTVLCMQASRLRAVAVASFADARAELQGGAVFAIERCEGLGAVHFGDGIFFRTSGGAHLGPSGKKATIGLTALPERYSENAVFRFEAIADGELATSTAAVRNGDTLCICRGQGADAQTLEVGGGYCHLKLTGGSLKRKAASISSRSLSVQLRPEAAQARAELSEALELAVKEGLSAGRLQREADGGLVTVRTEQIRQRLVGCIRWAAQQ